MRVSVIATSTVHPAYFAHIVRSGILEAAPDASVTVRALQAPAARRFHVIEVDQGHAFMADLLEDMIPCWRDCAEGQ